MVTDTFKDFCRSSQQTVGCP